MKNHKKKLCGRVQTRSARLFIIPAQDDSKERAQIDSSSSVISPFATILVGPVR